MPARALETKIKNEAAHQLKNPKLRVKDIMEWSSGEIEARDGEVVVKLEALGVWVAVPEGCDKRG